MWTRTDEHVFTCLRELGLTREVSRSLSRGCFPFFSHLVPTLDFKPAACTAPHCVQAPHCLHGPPLHARPPSLREDSWEKGGAALTASRK